MGHRSRFIIAACASAALLAGGCQLIVDADRPDGQSPLDGGATDAQDGGDGGAPDAMEILPFCQNGWEPTILPDLSQNGGLRDLMLTMPNVYTLNTDMSELKDPDGNFVEATLSIGYQEGRPVTVLMVKSLVIDTGVRLRAIGSRPLYIASSSTATINGVIDVSSSREGMDAEEFVSVGAGGDMNPHCIEGGAGAVGEGLDKGGAGGGLAGVGGQGGGGAMSGAALEEDAFVSLAGGCPGGAGGNGANGGRGGGAVMLFACVSITIDGSIRAHGSGGDGGGIAQGGGGGGSGGFIGIDTPTLTNTANQAFLLNGGGGGGGGAALLTPGTPGDDDGSRGDAGGSSSGYGGAGGTILDMTTLSGEAGATGAGDGGGGGGAGLLFKRLGSL